MPPGTMVAILPARVYTLLYIPGYTSLSGRHAGDHAADSRVKGLPR